MIVDEVLVEGSYFKRDDLPTILGNYMRAAEGYARDAKEYAVALVQAREERDALRAQLDSMTTEWGVAYKGFVSAEAVMEIGYEDVAHAHVGEGDVVVKRLAGPWVEVTD